MMIQNHATFHMTWLVILFKFEQLLIRCILEILLYMAGTLLANEFRDIRCNNVHVGRFVAIYFGHPGTLTVCEFEVFGRKFPSALCKNFLHVSL